MDRELIGGRYQVLQQIGAGGMAIVYLTRDLNLQRQVAVKQLRSNFADDTEFRVRFLQEARAAANLVHPNIVTIYDFGRDPQDIYIVMEYVEGTDLKTLLRRRSPLLHPEAVRLMSQICEGVGYAHRAGLVHCDLKPHNILVSNAERIKITDFGISRALATISPDEQLDVVWGSPQYFSPEQAAGTAPSPASDVYSLGVILYEMLTGRLPFEAADMDLLAELHQVAPVVPPSTYEASIPPKLDQILAKVLSKEPTARYRTADQFGQVLATFAEEQPSLPPTFQVPQDATRAVDPFHPDPVDWWAIGLGLLAFLAVGGLLPLWLWVWLLYQQ
ncbi:MAG: protein kinase [Anaerolineales bacterium]